MPKSAFSCFSNGHDGLGRNNKRFKTLLSVIVLQGAAALAGSGKEDQAADDGKYQAAALQQAKDKKKTGISSVKFRMEAGKGHIFQDAQDLRLRVR